MKSHHESLTSISHTVITWSARIFPERVPEVDYGMVYYLAQNPPNKMKKLVGL